MTLPADRLRETFVNHEYLAPDPAAVYAGLQERSRSYRRRRTVAKAAGGAVLGAGLVAGGFAVPGLLPSGASQTVVVTDPAAAPLTAAGRGQDADRNTEQELAAYFAAGYGYDDALRLAKLWQVPDNPATVKAEAGRMLLDGRALPIEPGPETTTSDDLSGTDATEARAVDAFFAAGYDYPDAVKLSKLWKSSDVYQTKIDAGTKLLAGRTLPLAP